MPYTKLQILRSTGSEHIPSAFQLDYGQLAVAYHTHSSGEPDGRIFYKDSNNVVQVITANRTGSYSGTFTGSITNAVTASFVSGAYVADWSRTSQTASFISGAYTAKWALTASNVNTSSFAIYAVTAAFALNGGGGGGGSGSSVRDTIVEISPSLNSLEMYTSSITNFGKSFLLFSTVVDNYARVRLYGSASHQLQDVTRSIGTDPASTAGVIVDLVLSGSPTYYNFTLSPMVVGSNRDVPVSNTIYYSVTNLTGGTTQISMSFNRLSLES